MGNNVSMMDFVSRGFVHLSPDDFSQKIHDIRRETNNVHEFLELFKEELCDYDTPTGIFFHPGIAVRTPEIFDEIPITLDSCSGVFAVFQQGRGVVSLVMLLSVSYSSLWFRRAGVAAGIKIHTDALDAAIIKLNGDVLDLLLLFEARTISKLFLEIIKQLCPDMLDRAKVHDDDLERLAEFTRAACAEREARTLNN